MNKVTIHQGHVLEVLKGMASESVQCIVTSPPYW
jgi:DNA modification methylase